MDNNPTLVHALGEVPGLVELTKTIIAQNEKTHAIYGKVLEQRVQAEISHEEVEKVVRSVVDGVQHTRCAAPDVTRSSELIAQAVLNRTQGAVENAVRETIKNTPITLDHHHTHTTALGLVQFAEEKTRNLLVLGWIAVGALLFWIGIALFCYYRSDAYWGAQYIEVLYSEYTTDAEADMLSKGCFTVSALPQEYKTHPSYVKDKIKQNQKVLKQRRKTGKDKNGNFSSSVPLER